MPGPLWFYRIPEVLRKRQAFLQKLSGSWVWEDCHFTLPISSLSSSWTVHGQVLCLVYHDVYLSSHFQSGTSYHGAANYRTIFTRFLRTTTEVSGFLQGVFLFSTVHSTFWLLSQSDRFKNKSTWVAHHSERQRCPTHNQTISHNVCVVISPSFY